MLEIEKLIAPSTRVTFNVKGEMKIDGMGMITPIKIAKDMVDIIPDEEFNKDTKFLDLACKSGNFLRCIHDRLMASESMIKAFPIDRERHFHIINNQLYGVALQQQDVMIATRNVYGQLVKDSHIVYIPSYIDRYISCRDIKGLQDKLKELTGQMKFDVIIGNPPYNNDMYLDFVTVAKNLIDKQEGNGSVCMITPAKWQAKTDGKPKSSKTPDKNVLFRENVVPYMHKVVFYRDTHEIFDIDDNAGMSYYIIDKTEHKEKTVKSICTKNKALESDTEIHDENNLTLLPRDILKIIGKVGTLGEGFKQSLYVKNTDHGESSIDGTLGFKRCIFTGEQERGEAIKQAGYVEVMQGEKVVGYKKKEDLFTLDKLDKWKCICSIMIGGAVMFSEQSSKVIGSPKVHKIGPNQVPKGSFPILRYFDTKEECESFISYFETKLVSFLFYLGVCGATLTKEFFRFIPDQEVYDHIFTDKELYEKYNLTEEEINVIESVIKDRK